MKKKILLRIILLILIFIWMYIVFGFSKHTGETSSSLSSRIANFFTNDENIVRIIEPIIRKIAHLSEYALGGFLIYGFLLTFEISSKKQIIISILLGIIYAITDEVHQLFVPGRSGQVKDVYIDSLGVILGVCVLLFIVKIVQFVKSKSIQNNKV